MYVEEDEDFKAIAVGESIALPNDYVSFYNNGLSVEDTQELEIDFYTKRGIEYLRAKAPFIDDREDYKKVYILDNIIYDDDLEEIAVGSISIEDTEFSLVIDGDNLVIGDIVIAKDLEKIEVDGLDVSSYDFDYITPYGKVISDPDKATDSDRPSIEITIPEEKLIGSISITTK